MLRSKCIQRRKEFVLSGRKRVLFPSPPAMILSSLFRLDTFVVAGKISLEGLQRFLSCVLVIFLSRSRD